MNTHEIQKIYTEKLNSKIPIKKNNINQDHFIQQIPEIYLRNNDAARKLKNLGKLN